MSVLKAALVQLNNGPDIQENIKITEDLVRRAADQGADLVCTPENTCHIRFSSADKLKSSLPEKDHPVLEKLSGLAREKKFWLLIGSLTIKLSDSKVANRSFLIDDTGAVVVRYDKIHLFDVDLPTGETHRESDVVQAGRRAVATQTPWGKMGLSICYDLRFAYLYRKLAQQGSAKILTVPAAFTVPTGKAHWEVLLRARAIETGSFVLAPAQCGRHEGGRETYGHSLVVGPWGEILAQGGDEPGIVTADIDPAAVDKARSAIPALKHDREIIP
ncbi:MAG: carbon-nitrogen hydrolase family protein [Proteobacteria bacterium]|nr:carbon-nitrogen hydrolase family protein [Pseudomonadota bacterium]